MTTYSIDECVWVTVGEGEKYHLAPRASLTSDFASKGSKTLCGRTLSYDQPEKITTRREQCCERCIEVGKP